MWRMSTNLFVMTIILLAACSVKSGASAADAVVEDSSIAQLDADPDVSPDAPAPTDVTATGVCADPHWAGDHHNSVNIGDYCFEGPWHYCAQGWAPAVTRVCPPGEEYCCDYASTCTPCSWMHCEGHPNRIDPCVGWPTKNNNVEPGSCPRVPTFKDPLCWDGLTKPVK